MKNWLSQKRILGLLKGSWMIILGVALLSSPEYTLISIARLVAALLLVKGVLSGIIILFSRSMRQRSTSVFEALFDLGVGLLILYNPGETISFIVVILAIWAMLGGLLLAFSFTSLRKVGVTSWGMFLNSIVALTFGLVLFFKPLRGGLALATIIGAFALVYGLINLYTVTRDHRI